MSPQVETPTTVEAAIALLYEEEKNRFAPPAADIFNRTPSVLDEDPFLLSKAKGERIRAAWRELDAIPIPRTTFEDSKGRPAYTILADGSRIYPTPSRVGTTREWDDDLYVGADLKPLRRCGTIMWDGSIPEEERGTLSGETRVGLHEPRQAERDFEEGERRAA